MDYGFPDWMFAAIAIAAWEIAAYVAHRFHVPYASYFGYGVIGVCALIIIIRYIIRWVKRPKDKQEPDPDEWKNY
jgi:hypothetical protein